jgi:ElaB/YqjD/DUF883 family membrane-anchored ribosome-binding protein
MDSRYETPDALRHDAHTIADDARALVTATAGVADEKVAAARRRLESALERGRELAAQAKERAMDGARSADELVRSHPYESVGISFALGAILGCLFGRR